MDYKDFAAWDKLVLSTVAGASRPLQCIEVARLVAERMDDGEIAPFKISASKVTYHMTRLREQGHVKSAMVGLGKPHAIFGWREGGMVKVWRMKNAPPSMLSQLRVDAERLGRLPDLGRVNPVHRVRVNFDIDQTAFQKSLAKIMGIPLSSVLPRPHTDDMRQMIEDLAHNSLSA